MEGRAAKVGLGFWTFLVVLFLWLPLTIILVYAFNTSNIQSWPIPGFTLRWFRVAWEDQEARDALLLSLKAALAATGIALVLGTMAAVAVSRFRFFGRSRSGRS
jgi:putative spermidine/putrescine transport system permease protein